MIIKKLLIASLAASLLTTTLSYAEEHDHSSPDSIAPVGIMYDHTHSKGKYMLGYRFDYMEMEGHRANDKKVSKDDVVDHDGYGYRMAAQQMRMKMHMLDYMYGATNKLTLGIMPSFTETEMIGHYAAPNHTSHHPDDMKFQGIGDTKISASYSLSESKSTRQVATLAINIPTGSISKSMEGTRTSYMMQLGTGTVDLLPYYTIVGNFGPISLGGQASANIKTMKNRYNYAFGNSFIVSSWVTAKILPAASISFRAEWKKWNGVRGEDTSLISPTHPGHPEYMMPYDSKANQGGQRLDLFLGANISLSKTLLLRIEGGRTVYQRLNGLQMAFNHSISAGVQKRF